MHGRREPANVSVFDEAPLRPFPSVGATWPHLCEFLWNFIRNHDVTDNISSNLELRMNFNQASPPGRFLTVCAVVATVLFGFVTDAVAVLKVPIRDRAGNRSGQSECSVAADLKDAGSSGRFQHVLFLHNVQRVTKKKYQFKVVPHSEMNTHTHTHTHTHRCACVVHL